MPRGQSWGDDKIARLFHMRDELQMSWHEIGARFGVSGPCACTRYNYHSAKRRIAEQRARVLAEAADVARRPPIVVPRPVAPPQAPAVAAPPPAPPDAVKRPRYFHDGDMEIRSRIASQGLTAGFLGDPPPGRSALDQRGAGK